jgi:hypothetical protein
MCIAIFTYLDSGREDKRSWPEKYKYFPNLMWPWRFWFITAGPKYLNPATFCRLHIAVPSRILLMRNEHVTCSALFASVSKPTSLLGSNIAMSYFTVLKFLLKYVQLHQQHTSEFGGLFNSSISTFIQNFAIAWYKSEMMLQKPSVAFHESWYPWYILQQWSRTSTKT